MRKTLSLLLALILALSLAAPALAAPAKEEDQAAWTLYHLGLFQGAEEDAQGFPVFALDRVPTRAEGITMLVRLLGREKEALAGTWETPFTDVPDWALPYVGYAYDAGLTDGTGEDTFSPGVPISAAEYLTLVLRALGYVSGEDFSWEQAWNLTDTLGITNGQYSVSSSLASPFDRGDVAWISFHALEARNKSTNVPLRRILEGRGVKSEADQVIWQETLQTCEKGRMVFSLSPSADSPRTYLRYTVDAAWANGVPCGIRQYTSKSEVGEQVRKLGLDREETVGEDAFSLFYLTYDEEKVLAAAEQTVQAGGQTFPVIRIQIMGTGTLAGGSAVKEKAQMEYYVQSYFGAF